MSISDDFSAEIMSSMRNNLAASSVEKTHSFKKLAKAIDYLNDAAEIFDDNGLYIQSSELGSVLSSLVMEQLISQGSTLAEFLDKTKHLPVDELKDSLKLCDAKDFLELVKMISKASVGDIPLMSELNDVLKDKDISVEDIKSRLIDKVVSALTQNKIFA